MQTKETTCVLWKQIPSTVIQNIPEVFDLLYSLGITANYTGFFYVSYAVYLIQLQPERLQLVTKWLYPGVAAHFHTSWKAVERNIRTAVGVAWELRPEMLERIHGGSLSKRPSNARFLAILANYLRCYTGTTALLFDSCADVQNRSCQLP